MSLPPLTNNERRSVIGCGLALVIGSLAAWPTIALSQAAPVASATPDPAALSEYRPEALPLRDYSRDPDPFRADILVSRSEGRVKESAATSDVPHLTVAPAPPGVVPDIVGNIPIRVGSIPGVGPASYGTVRGLGTDFALIERNGSLPIVRVGDVLGDATVTAITELGVTLSNGVVLPLDTTPPSPAPHLDRAAAPAAPAAPASPNAIASPAPIATPSLTPEAPLPPRLAPTTQGNASYE